MGQCSFTLQPRNGHRTDPDPARECATHRARLMALTIRFEGLIRRGQMQDSGHLARLGYVTRARITQIMNLLYLAPDIQEALLLWPAIHSPIGSSSMAATSPRDRCLGGAALHGQQRLAIAPVRSWQASERTSNARVSPTR